MKILVPIDLSDCSINALRYAFDFGKKLNAKITILHTLITPKTSSDITQEINVETSISSIVKNIKQLVSELPYSSNELSEIICKQGELIEVIKQEYAEKTFDLIVLGSHGKGNLKEFLLGSKAAVAIEHAPCPIMVIPPNTGFNQLKKVIYATNYEDTDAKSLEGFIDLIAPSTPEITMLHVVTKEEKEEKSAAFKDLVQSAVKYSNLLFHSLAHLTVWDGINAHAQWENTDLVIVSNKKRELLDKDLDYSISKDVAFYSRIPVLTYHH